MPTSTSTSTPAVLGPDVPSSAAVTTAAARPFGIAGSVGGLYPGRAEPLVLKVTNPYPFAIVVTSLATTVGAAGVGCGGGYLAVPAFSGQMTVLGSGSAHVSVTVKLAHSAPNACQGRVFPLKFSGVARKA
jgi:hypothetical protein